MSVILAPGQIIPKGDLILPPSCQKSRGSSQACVYFVNARGHMRIPARTTDPTPAGYARRTAYTAKDKERVSSMFEAQKRREFDAMDAVQRVAAERQLKESVSRLNQELSRSDLTQRERDTTRAAIALLYARHGKRAPKREMFFHEIGYESRLWEENLRKEHGAE